MSRAVKRQIKTFADDSKEGLDKKVNGWIEGNTQIQVIGVSLSVIRDWYNITVLYEMIED